MLTSSVCVWYIKNGCIKKESAQIFSDKVAQNSNHRFLRETRHKESSSEGILSNVGGTRHVRTEPLA